MPVCERLARVYLFVGSIPALDRLRKDKEEMAGTFGL